jgi:choline dehydrogenase-like flavoprotein
VKDANTGEITEYYARIIFCNASTVGTAAILLNSRSETFPDGLGNGSGELGHNIMDHHYQMGASGTLDGFEDEYYRGRKPKGFYIPPFTNISEETKQQDYIRNFGYQGGATRASKKPDGVIGKDLKEVMFEPGKWRINLHCFGEILPYHDNRMYLNFDKRDKHGMPIITFDAKLRENEVKMRVHGVKAAAEMLEAAGCTDIRTFNRPTLVGECIHEMGTARMGHDPKTSVLNKWNQMHEVPNVFVTDGACMTSAGSQNPSITYMALSARAVDYADKQIKSGKL